MSPAVTKKGIRWNCDWLTCTKSFDTYDEANHHMVHDHFPASWGCKICASKK